MSDNPFEAPKSTITEAQRDASVAVLLGTPRKNSIGHGWKWIKEGFGLFKLSPWLWIGVFLIYIIIAIVLSILPLGSLLLNVVNPVLMAGLIYGAYELDQDRALKISNLFDGFKRNTGSLFAIGGLYLLGIILVVVVAMGIAFATGGFDVFSEILAASANGGQAPAIDPQTIMSSFILPALIGMALMIPLMMSIWFSPALVILHDMGAVEAMKRSFNGCIKNMFPYLWYGIIAMVLMIIGVIPLGLGLLIVLPVITIAIYTSYKDIFID